MVTYREFRPHAALHDSLKCFWVLERDYTPAHPTDELTPDACVELIFNFGSPYVLERGGLRRQLPPVYLVGPQAQAMTLRSSGVVRLVAARFHAWGLLPFLAIDAGQGSASALALDDGWRAISDRLRGAALAGEYDRAVALLEDFLIGRRQTLLYEPSRTSNGSPPPRRLKRPFAGLKPQARSLRLEQIRERLMIDLDANLTDLAREFGFADPAHLINDFRTFSGKTPADFAASMRAFQSALRDHENVVFLQTLPALAECAAAG